jgi:murein DD-endopeptidase MepM/ murein hydrolase activator NlpD
MSMIDLPKSAPAVIAAAILMAPSLSHAGRLGDLCRHGNMASCRTLCRRGFKKACAKASGRVPGGGKLMVEFGENLRAEVNARGLIHTGLKPIFPKNADCQPIASRFADTTRYDGSKRAARAMFGLHEGIDLSLPIGTPIIAIASGTVINKRHGGLLIGNEVFLRHSPKDTGLKVWTFSKYKHFSKVNKLKVGQKVAMGQVLGLSGNTGTVGGYYGKNGYAHLHMSTYMNETGAYTIKEGRVDIKDPHYVDPVAFFFRRELHSNVIRKMPASERKVIIPYMTDKKVVVPENTKAVWPVFCKSR